MFYDSWRVLLVRIGGVRLDGYMDGQASNGNEFRGAHDEVDMEFLGDVRAGAWRLQTNVYGNSSTGRGREERYRLPFDPTLRAHRYSILWANHSIM